MALTHAHKDMVPKGFSYTARGNITLVRIVLEDNYLSSYKIEHTHTLCPINSTFTNTREI